MALLPRLCRLRDGVPRSGGPARGSMCSYPKPAITFTCSSLAEKHTTREGRIE